jgi:hypothetical protein
MGSYKEVYNREVEGLFGNLKRTKFEEAQTADAARQEGSLGPLVPFSINGSDVFDETDTMDILVYVPDVIMRVVEARVVLAFKEFFAPATTVVSGGGSTSGASSSETSSAAGSHNHLMFDYISDIPNATTARRFQARINDGGAGTGVTLDQEGGAGDMWTFGSAAAHQHTLIHTHSTPAHAHDLSYGVYKEALPASHSVTLTVFQWDGSAWVLVTTIGGLTGMVEDIDLTDHIVDPGKYRISLQSAGGQPNGGRLGCDAAGYVVGAIQPR